MRQIFDDDYGLNEYQKDCSTTAIYPGRLNSTLSGINYTTLGLVGEAGELANKLKKVIRDDRSIISCDSMMKLRDELGDVLWYVAMLAEELEISLADLAKNNRAKLMKRAEEKKLQGSGDNR